MYIWKAVLENIFRRLLNMTSQNKRKEVSKEKDQAASTTVTRRQLSVMLGSQKLLPSNAIF